ncbi:MAG TPA: helix-turn-helix domain-containing protein [Terriglobales bacterium]|jgi:hypothetical protein|nr:helix-turn-helix domain-containing protein [Terriglobales bacterium]
MPEIWTIDDVAAFLKMTPSQVYTMTRRRGQARMEHALPVRRINGNLRFDANDIREWWGKFSQERAA